MKKDTKKLEVNVFGGSHFSKNANDHTGSNDGNNVQVGLNYGTNLGKEKSFINVTLSGQLRGETSRAKEVTGTLFNRYNAVEERARLAGVNINSLYGNTLNRTPGFYNGLLNEVNTYAQGVSYFDATTRSGIQTAATTGNLAAMRTLLAADATADELAFRGLVRNDFNMRVG